jgi:hypothetical protein
MARRPHGSRSLVQAGVPEHRGWHWRESR